MSIHWQWYIKNQKGLWKCGFWRESKSSRLRRLASTQSGSLLPLFIIYYYTSIIPLLQRKKTTTQSHIALIPFLSEKVTSYYQSVIEISANYYFFLRICGFGIAKWRSFLHWTSTCMNSIKINRFYIKRCTAIAPRAINPWSY